MNVILPNYKDITPEEIEFLGARSKEYTAYYKSDRRRESIFLTRSTNKYSVRSFLDLLSTSEYHGQFPADPFKRLAEQQSRALIKTGQVCGVTDVTRGLSASAMFAIGESKLLTRLWKETAAGVGVAEKNCTDGILDFLTTDDVTCKTRGNGVMQDREEPSVLKVVNNSDLVNMGLQEAPPKPRSVGERLYDRFATNFKIKAHRSNDVRAKELIRCFPALNEEIASRLSVLIATFNYRGLEAEFGHLVASSTAYRQKEDI